MDLRSEKSAFTVVDVLVVVLLSVFLLMVLPPVLQGPWGGTAYRMTCGTNLSCLGKAMLIYANDYGKEFPHAGPHTTSWAARTPNWQARDRMEAYGLPVGRGAGRATVSASLYLLVKYEEIEPKWFLCPQDGQAAEFVPSRYRARGELTDFWDFGPEPPKHVSYSYHMPYGRYALTTSSSPGMAVAADRNPWMDSPFAKARDFSQFKPNMAPFNGMADQVQAGNCLAHNGDGQNVLFLDSHVDFVRTSYCGIDDDNIYTSWDGADKARGKPPVFGSQPADPNDSFLVNDPAVWPR